MDSEAEPATGAETAPRKRRSFGQTDLIVREILRGLHEGRFVPGQRLVEADLIAAFGTSRSVVREAFNRLAANGLVELSRFRGASIRRLSPKAMKDTLVLLELLLSLAARLAAEHIDESDNRARLERAAAMLFRNQSSVPSYEMIRARDAWYRALIGIGGNSELARILASLQVQLIRVHVRSDQLELRRFDEYRAITAAVLAGDAARAEALCRSHVRAVAAVIDLQLDPAKNRAERMQRAVAGPAAAAKGDGGGLS